MDIASHPSLVYPAALQYNTMLEMVYTLTAGVHKLLAIPELPNKKFILQGVLFNSQTYGTALAIATGGQKIGFTDASATIMQMPHPTVSAGATGVNFMNSIVSPVNLGEGEIYLAASVVGTGAAGRVALRAYITGFFLSTDADPDNYRFPLAPTETFGGTYPPLDNA